MEIMILYLAALLVILLISGRLIGWAIGIRALRDQVDSLHRAQIDTHNVMVEILAELQKTNNKPEAPLFD